MIRYDCLNWLLPWAYICNIHKNSLKLSCQISFLWPTCLWGFCFPIVDCLCGSFLTQVTVPFVQLLLYECSNFRHRCFLFVYPSTILCLGVVDTNAGLMYKCRLEFSSNLSWSQCKSKKILRTDNWTPVDIDVTDHQGNRVWFWIRYIGNCRGPMCKIVQGFSWPHENNSMCQKR